MKCKRCGHNAKPKITSKGPHRTAYCRKCGRYIKHIPRKQPATVGLSDDVRMLNPGDRGYAQSPTYRRQIKRKD